MYCVIHKVDSSLRPPAKKNLLRRCETVNPTPRDESWMRHKNVLCLLLSPFYPNPDLILPVTHKAPVVCTCV